MGLRWKKNENPTGLAAIGSAPRGSKLWGGETVYARVSALGGNWRHELAGWYWVAGWDSDLPHMNTCEDPCETEQEAKEQAKEYVLKHLKGGEDTNV